MTRGTVYSGCISRLMLCFFLFVGGWKHHWQGRSSMLTLGNIFAHYLNVCFFLKMLTVFYIILQKGESVKKMREEASTHCRLSHCMKIANNNVDMSTLNA